MAPYSEDGVASADTKEPKATLSDIPMAPELLAKPEGFDFYQAVVILRWIVARLSVPNKIRFRSLFSLSFASSDLVEVNMPSEGGRPIDMIISFLGLGSAGSIIPMPYLEQVLEQQKQGERGITDYLGIFNDRLIFLLVESKMQRKLSLSLQTQGVSPLTRFLSHLAGPLAPVRLDSNNRFVSLEQLSQSKDGVPESIWPQLLLLSSLLARRIASARSLSGILGAYSGFAVAVEEFQGGWQRLAEPQRTVLGQTGRNRRLGDNLVLGKRVWLEEVGLSILFDTRVRGDGMVWLRDLRRLRSLFELIILHLGNGSIQFRFVFVIGAGELEKLTLGSGSLDSETLGSESLGSKSRPMLGWTTVLHSGHDPFPNSARFVVSYDRLRQLAHSIT